MNILYAGGYKKRFNQVIEQLKDLPANSQVLELCFGDTYIAEYCKNKGYRWKGIDLNRQFVAHAQKLGFDAAYGDLTSAKNLPDADVCIMMGSLYHFHPHTFSVLNKMSNAADIVIISEPVSNLSADKGILGYFARRAASVGKGNEAFRYDSISLMTLMEEISTLLNRRISFCERYKKDLIIKLIKNGSY